MNESVPWWIEKVPNFVLRDKIKQYYKHFSSINCNAKIYYLTNYFNSCNNDVNQVISRLLTCIPQVCVGSDSYIQLKNKKLVYSYKEALEQDSELLTYDERILSRRKIIMSTSRVFASGGYNSQIRVFDENTANTMNQVIILSAYGCQFDVPQLDYKLFIDANNGNLLWEKYVTSMTQDVGLWLLSIENYMSSCGDFSKHNKKAQFRVCPIGAGWFSRIHGYEGGTIGPLVQLGLLIAFKRALTYIRSNLSYLEHIEFTFFSDNVLQQGEKIVNQLHELFPCTFTNNDICAPLPKHQSFRQLIILNPSDTFCMPGAEFEYQSVEAQIGNNSTLRIDQSYQINAQLLKHTNYIPVKL